MNDALAASYRACHAIVRGSGSNFALAFWLLPREKRRGMDALYAFARLTDDLGDDGAASTAERREQLQQWRDQLHAALDRRPCNSAVLPALADTVARFEIPPALLTDIIAGVERDLMPCRYETWQELGAYCYQVAGAVGLACLPIWGTRRAPNRAAAIACGEAFQLTNILRDVREDALRDRLYLPLEDLQHCGCTFADLQHGKESDAVDRLLRFQVQRATALYAQAAPLHEDLSREGARVFRLMFGRYRAILAAIEREPIKVLERRVSLPLSQKLWIAGRQLLATKP